MSAGKCKFFFAAVDCRFLYDGRINAIHIHILSAFVQTLGKHKHNESLLEEIVGERRRLTREKRLFVYGAARIDNMMSSHIANFTYISRRVKIAHPPSSTYTV